MCSGSVYIWALKTSELNQCYCNKYLIQRSLSSMSMSIEQDNDVSAWEWRMSNEHVFWCDACFLSPFVYPDFCVAIIGFRQINVPQWTALLYLLYILQTESFCKYFKIPKWVNFIYFMMIFLEKCQEKFVSFISRTKRKQLIDSIRLWTQWMHWTLN